jgi:hypothetical protein
MYMVHLVRIPSGADPLQSARIIVVDGEDPEDDVTVDLDNLAKAAERAWPQLARETETIGEDRTIYFVLSDEKNDLEIELSETGAIVTLPQNDDLRLTEDFWSGLSACVQTLQFQGGWTAYDPQLDRILYFPNDAAAVRIAYEQARSNPEEPALQRILLAIKPVYILVIAVIIVGLQFLLNRLNVMPSWMAQILTPLILFSIISYIAVKLVSRKRR